LRDCIIKTLRGDADGVFNALGVAGDDFAAFDRPPIGDLSSSSFGSPTLASLMTGKKSECEEIEEERESYNGLRVWREILRYVAELLEDPRVPQHNDAPIFDQKDHIAAFSITVEVFGWAVDLRSSDY
jgi:hypothetical protein